MGNKGTRSRAQESQADKIVKLALGKDVRLFRDQFADNHILINIDEHNETHLLRSRPVKDWLSGLLWQSEEKAPGSEALSSALNVLGSMAMREGVIPLYNRVAASDSGGIWIDLTDFQWRAIHVNQNGWKIHEYPPIIFKRFSHQQPLPDPAPRGGDVTKLLDFANIRSDEERLLYTVAVISYFIPDIPHPVMILHGPQGSGKTSMLRIARGILDPSSLQVLAMPRNPRELVQNLNHHHCSFFDNIGQLRPWASDVLCRAVTGTGVSKRRLYSDDEDIIYSFRRCVALTGINIAAERGDLLERSILLGLESINKRDRRTEKEIEAHLAEAKPIILGGILDVLSKALAIHPQIRLEELFRMADFTRWGYAITEALGLDPETFIEAYRKNIDTQYIEAIKSSPVAEVLLSFMDNQTQGSWEGTATQLYGHLNETAEAMNISTRQKAWPKNPRALGRRLNEISPSLPSVGYGLYNMHTGKARKVVVYNVNNVTNVSHHFKSGDKDPPDTKTASQKKLKVT